MTKRIAGWEAKETTAKAYFECTTPDEMEDAYVVKDGRLREVWDVGISLVGGMVALYGNWPEHYAVPLDTPIYFSPAERWQ